MRVAMELLEAFGLKWWFLACGVAFLGCVIAIVREILQERKGNYKVWKH